ncbi:hypothetical protein WJX77_007503 [Trebouxia sp. C0004]
MRRDIWQLPIIVLFGVDSTKHLLHDVNMVEDSSTDLHHTPTDALAAVKDMSSVQHSDGSDDSRKWGNLSPFSEDHLISLQPMTQTQIAGILKQFTTHRSRSQTRLSIRRQIPTERSHGRKRVDLVLIDSGVLPAHAVNLLVSSSKDEMHEHWYRAVDVYQKLYTYENVPCTVQVVNICSKRQRGYRI